MSQLYTNIASCNQECQTVLSGSPPYISESPSNSYLVSHSHNNANSDFLAGLNNLCLGQNSSINDSSSLSPEFRQKLWSLFHQIEVEFERECKKISNENFTGHERNEKVEISDHDETNFAKKISGSHLSQKIKQQYKQSKQSTHRFVSTLRERGSTTNQGVSSGVSNVPVSSSGGNSLMPTNVTQGGTGGHSTRRPNSELIWRATEHRDGIWEVNTVGRSLVGTACADGVVRLWSSDNGHCCLVYLGHSGSVNSVRFKNGIMLTASGDGTAHLIHLPTDKLHDDFNSGAPNKQSVVDYPNIGDVGSSNNANNPSEDLSHSSSFKKYSHFPDENYETGEQTVTSSSSLPIVLRNPNSLYQTAASLLGPIMPPLTQSFNSNNVTTSTSNNAPMNTGTVGMGSDGPMTTLGGGPTVTSGLNLGAMPFSAASALNYTGAEHGCGLASYQDSAPLSAADFLLPRDQIVTASWDRVGRIYDINTGSELATLTGHDLPLTDVRTRPDQCLAVTCSRDCTFRLWDFRCSATEVHVQQGHNGVVSCVNFLDGDKLLSAGADRYCKLWDLRHNRSAVKEFRTDSPINRVAVHPAGKLVALPMDNRTIKLIDLALGSRVARFPRSSSQSHSRMVTSVAWTKDGLGRPNLFSVSFDHQLFAWNVQLANSAI